MYEDSDREIIQEYSDGTVVYGVISEDPPDNLGLPDIFVVEDANGAVYEFTGRVRWQNRRRSLLMGELCQRVSELTITDSPKTVPVNIALMGKPAMAAYLDAVHQSGRQQIADSLEVSLGTIRQYLSDFRRGRR